MRKERTDADTTSYADGRGQAKCVREVGATHPSGVSATAEAALVAPAPTQHVSRKYRTRIFH